MRILISIGVATLSLIGGNDLSDQAEKLQHEWRWSHFGLESGLPAGQVISVFETRRGVPWVVTNRGLAWYDGFRWNSVGEDEGLFRRTPLHVSQGTEGGLLVTMSVPALVADRDDPMKIGYRLFVGGKSGFRKVEVVSDVGELEVFCAVPTTGDSLIVCTQEGFLVIREAEKGRATVVGKLPLPHRSRGGRSLPGAHRQRSALGQIDRCALSLEGGEVDSMESGGRQTPGDIGRRRSVFDELRFTRPLVLEGPGAAHKGLTQPT